MRLKKRIFFLTAISKTYICCVSKLDPAPVPKRAKFILVFACASCYKLRMKKTNISMLLTALSALALMGCATASYQPGLRPSQPAVTDAIHHEGRFVGTENTKLFEQSWAPLKGSSKAVVIFVHGLKDHSDRYAEVARQLTQNSFSVYAFDLRGHAESEGHRVWTDSFDDYVQDLEIFYDRVHKVEPNKPIFLFGHSMGGAIATTFALKKSRPLAGLILSAPALKVGEDINGFLIATTKVLGSVFPTMAVLKLDDEAFSRDPKVVQSIKNDPLVYHGKGPARTAKELLKAIANIQEKMPELDIPFITLHGDKDVLTNPEGSQELFAKAKTTDKSIKIYPGVYHDLLHEPEKGQVYADILEWLKAHSQEATPAKTHKGR